MNGVLLVDKPAGMTSHGVVSKIRKIAGQKKVGHAGTLDPDATGLLIVCLGEATKVSQYLMTGHKRYSVEFQLGQTSTTYDTAGELSERVSVSLQEKAIVDALSGFLGKQKQRPPIYSAIKKDGKKLYEYARAGKEVEIPERDVEIFDLVLSSFSEATGEGSLQIWCTKGTYVRSLVHDLGQALEVGAVAKNIRRLESGSFSVNQALSLSELQSDTSEDLSGRLITVSKSLEDYSQLQLSKELVSLVRHGQSLSKKDLEGCSWAGKGVGDPHEMVLVTDQSANEVALCERTSLGGIKIRRVFAS